MRNHTLLVYVQTEYLYNVSDDSDEVFVPEVVSEETSERTAEEVPVWDSLSWNPRRSSKEMVGADPYTTDSLPASPVHAVRRDKRTSSPMVNIHFFIKTSAFLSFMVSISHLSGKVKSFA